MLLRQDKRGAETNARKVFPTKRSIRLEGVHAMKMQSVEIEDINENNEVIEEMISVIRKVGSGSGGTRNISGTTPYHQGLEVALAKFHGRESALVFNSAYLANQTVIWTICKALKDIVVFSDSLNHASLIQGIKNSGAKCHIFKHNDIEHLETLLKEWNQFEARKFLQ